jgi:mono/diheme cytochrome c family protein
MTLKVLVALTVVLSTACKGHEFEPPDRKQRVTEAERRYMPARFDTIQWDSAGARLTEGNLVYAASCRKCHGPLGEGGTDYAREQNLDPPSLVRADWPHAASIDSVRHRIFVGHPSGMPTWGVAGLSPREIDAVAYYIIEQLRVDAVSGR